MVALVLILQELRKFRPPPKVLVLAQGVSESIFKGPAVLPAQLAV